MLKASHFAAGGGFAGLVGVTVVGLLARLAHVHFTTEDAFVLGAGVVSAGAGIANVIARYGIAGLFHVVMHGQNTPPQA